MNRERRIIIAALSLTAALFAPVLGRAQQVQHPYIYVTVLQVKHDNVTRRQWEASRRAWVAMAQKSNRPLPSQVFQQVIGNPDEFHIIQPLDELGTPGAILGSPGTEAEMLRWYDGASQTVESWRTRLSAAEPEISIPLAEGREPVLMEVITRNISVENSGEFLRIRREVLMPAYQKMKTNGIYVNQLLYGGDRGDWTVARVYDSWDHLRSMRGAMNEALGAEGVERMRNSIESIATSSHWTLLRYRPGLSYVPE